MWRIRSIDAGGAKFNIELECQEMTFYNLVRSLGTSHPSIWRPAGASFFQCDLSLQPLDHLKEMQGCSIRLSEVGHAVLEIPVDEGVARIIGTVRLEEDGSQTLTDVTAFRVDRQPPAAGSASDASE